MSLSYEVSDDLVVSIWPNSEKNGEPMIVQPFPPAGGEWESAEDCALWAENFVTNFDIPEYIKNPSEPEPVEEALEEEAPTEEEPSA